MKVDMPLNKETKPNILSGVFSNFDMPELERRKKWSKNEWLNK